MSNIPLSTISPDYQSLRAQLQNILSQKQAWLDQLPSGTGQALIDFIASIGAFDQFSIESILQEEFFDTQKFTSSTYAKARTLGVRLSRKVAASVVVNLVQDALAPVDYIPAYTQFSANGVMLFNREAIIPNVDITQVRLYEGTVKVLTTRGQGSPFQRFITEERDFIVSDSDVMVLLDGDEVPVTTRGLWHYQEQPAVQDGTTREGQLVLTFGNDYYGSNPKSGSIVTLRYVTTSGDAANNSSFTDTDVKCNDFPKVKGKAVTGLSGGASQPNPEVYKNIGPHIYSSGDKSITHAQYNARAAQYPGVIDALVVGQRYVAPQDRRYMNLLRTSVLADPAWSDTEWEAFVAWFYDTTMHNLELYREDPKPRDFDAEIEVVCNATADLTEVKNKVTSVLTNFFALGYGSIGRKIYLSEIYEVLRHSSPDIHHVNINKPTFNIISNLRVEGFKAEATPPVSGGIGQLEPGVNYTYWLTAVGADGVESLPEQTDGTVLTAGHRLTLTWDAHPFAVKYRLYGRTRTGTGLLIETTALSFTDTGVATPTAGNYPTVDATGVYFPRCTNMDITTRYVRDTVRK